MAEPERGRRILTQAVLPPAYSIPSEPPIPAKDLTPQLAAPSTRTFVLAERSPSTMTLARRIEGREKRASFHRRSKCGSREADHAGALHPHAAGRAGARPQEGKQSGTPLHRGTLGDGMRAAIAEIKSSYPEMIEGWQGQ